MQQTPGLTFAPPTAPDRQDQAGASAALGPSQRALEIISLHLPRLLGSRAISPSSLVSGPGGGGAPGGLSPESAVLQTAMRQNALQGGGAPGGGAPSALGIGPTPDLAGASSVGPQGADAGLGDFLQRLIEALTAGGGGGASQPAPRVTFGDTGSTVPPAPAPPVSQPIAPAPEASTMPAVPAVGRFTPGHRSFGPAGGGF